MIPTRQSFIKLLDQMVGTPTEVSKLIESYAPVPDFEWALRPVLNKKGEADKEVEPMRKEILISLIIIGATKFELLTTMEKECDDDKCHELNKKTLNDLALGDYSIDLNYVNVNPEKLPRIFPLLLENTKVRWGTVIGWHLEMGGEPLTKKNFTRANFVGFHSIDNRLTELNFTDGYLVDCLFDLSQFVQVNFTRTTFNNVLITRTIVDQETLDTLDLENQGLTLVKAERDPTITIESGQYWIKPRERDFILSVWFPKGPLMDTRLY
jgi:hypothetical protein